MKTDKQMSQAAAEFAERWQGRGYERGESQLFWADLLTNVYGVENLPSFIRYEEQVKNMVDSTNFIDGHIPSTRVLIEQKSLGKDLRLPIPQSDGSKLNPFQQAKRYVANMPVDEHPKWIVTCNFEQFLVYDMNQPNGEPEEIWLKDLGKEYYRLQFLVDQKSEHLSKEMQVSMILQYRTALFSVIQSFSGFFLLRNIRTNEAANIAAPTAAHISSGLQSNIDISASVRLRLLSLSISIAQRYITYQIYASAPSETISTTICAAVYLRLKLYSPTFIEKLLLYLCYINHFDIVDALFHFDALDKCFCCIYRCKARDRTFNSLSAHLYTVTRRRTSCLGSGNNVVYLAALKKRHDIRLLIFAHPVCEVRRYHIPDKR